MTDTQRIQELERQLADMDMASAGDVRVRIDLLNDLAWALSDQDMKRAYDLGGEAVRLSGSKEDGKAYYREGAAHGLRTMGYINQRLGTFPLGLSQLFEARTLFEQMPLCGGLGDTLDGIAGIYQQIAEYPEALSYMLNQLDVAQQLGDKHRIANANNNLGTLYYATGEAERTMELLQGNLQLAIEIGYERIECISCLNLSEAWSAKGDLEQALKYAQHGLQISRQAGFELFEVHSMHYLGQIYLEQGDTSQAIDYLQRGLTLATKVGSQVVETLILLSIGEAYRRMHQSDQALVYGHEAMALAESIDAKSELAECHLLLSEINEEQGEFEQALSHQKKRYELNEVMLGEKANRRLQVLKVAHDTETAKKEAEIAHLRTVELQQEIAEHTRVRGQLQRQLEFVHALSEFNQTLLASSKSDVDSRRILAAALQYLLQPTHARTIMLFQNYEDAELGLHSRQYALATYDVSQPKETNRATAMGYREFLREQIPGITKKSNGSTPVFLPWSLIPTRVTDQLTAGKWVGGPVVELFADVPEFRDFLIDRQGLYSLLIFPIHIGDYWWGAIVMTEGSGQPLPADGIQTPSVAEGMTLRTEDEILLLDTAAEIVSSTLQRWQAEENLRALNHQLEQQVQKRTAELSETVDQLQEEVAERKRAEAEIQHMVEMLEQRVADRSRELAALYEMTILFTGTNELENALEPALNNICGSVGCDGIAIHILSADKSKLQLSNHLPVPGWEPVKDISLNPDFMAWLQKGDPPLMFAGGSDTYPFLPKELLIPTHPTYFGIALRIRNELIGLLSVYRKQSTVFGIQEVSLLITMAEQLGVIIQNHRLNQQSQQMTRAMERQQLARKLHDSVAQRIYSLNLFARAGQDAVSDGDLENAQLRLQQVEENALYALREMRLLLYQLRPLALEDQSLVAAFEERFQLVERRLGIESVIEATALPELGDNLEEELYYVVTEALNNALRHAQATRVELKIQYSDPQLSISVRDNGRGFDLGSETRGNGLDNMESRVAKIGGHLDLETAQGKGTVIHISV
ncbi:MAG: tetratricopeptide repeat protein [Chloroflexota bacterium]